MQTSINIKPCITQSSERHNLRHKELPHLLAVENGHESLVLADISPTLAAIKAKYLASTGQAMQKKATPIREGVVVIAPSTTMNDLRRLGDAYRKAFGIRAIQYHIHRDEGQSIEKRNLHAHIVFDWTDEATGKSIKLNKQRMSEMQTITAEVLGMERGHSSDIKHLNAVQFKAEKAEKRVEQAEKEIEQAKEWAELIVEAATNEATKANDIALEAAATEAETRAHIEKLNDQIEELDKEIKSNEIKVENKHIQAAVNLIQKIKSQIIEFLSIGETVTQEKILSTASKLAEGYEFKNAKLKVRLKYTDPITKEEIKKIDFFNGTFSANKSGELLFNNFTIKEYNTIKTKPIIDNIILEDEYHELAGDYRRGYHR